MTAPTDSFFSPKWLCYLVIVVAALLVQLPPASAADNEWAVVPATRGEMPTFMQGLVVEIGRELERQGQSVWSAQGAAARFELERSQPSPITEAALDRWLVSSRAGIRHLALGDHEVALHHLEKAVRIPQPTLVSLNRDEAHAARVLDTCLYMVRALLELQDEDAASEQVVGCVSMAPRGQPQRLMHPPRVLALYERAIQAATDEATGLVVQSERQGCDVRVNGVKLGQTPLETHELGTGDYAVQVECASSRPGRIHPAVITDGEARLYVDTVLDRAIRTEPILRLEYPAPSSVRARTSAARGIATALPARWVVLVSLTSSDRIELDLVSGTGTRFGCGRIAVSREGLRSDELRVAVRKLVEGKCPGPSTARATRARRGQSAPLFKPEI